MDIGKIKSDGDRTWHWITGVIVLLVGYAGAVLMLRHVLVG